MKLIDQRITRLKRWLADPETHIPDPVQTPRSSQSIDKAIKAIKSFNEAMAKIAQPKPAMEVIGDPGVGRSNGVACYVAKHTEKAVTHQEYNQINNETNQSTSEWREAVIESLDVVVRRMKQNH